MSNEPIPIESLASALVSIETVPEMVAFLRDLSTPAELRALAERWQVCKTLAQNNASYRAIHRMTGASLTTIGRVARFLKDEPYGGYRKVLGKLVKRGNIEEKNETV